MVFCSPGDKRKKLYSGFYNRLFLRTPVNKIAGLQRLSFSSYSKVYTFSQDYMPKAYRIS